MDRTLRLVDLGLSSGVNFLLGVILARGSSAGLFGLYSFLILGYLLVLFLSRGLVGEGALLSRVGQPDRIAAGCSAATAIGVVCALAGAGSALALSTGLPGSVVAEEPQRVVLLVSLSLPFVALQDGCRHLLLAAQRTWAACFSDGSWLLVAAVAVVIGSRSSPSVAVGVWCAGGVLATGMALGALGWPRLSLRLVRGWLHGVGWRRTAGLLLDNLTMFATSLVFSIVTVAVLDLATLGAIRKALLALAPVSVLNSALTVMLLADRHLLKPTWQRCFQLALVSMAPAAVWGLLLVGPARAVGPVLVGADWSVAATYVPVLSGYLAMQAAALVGIIMIKRVGDAVLAGQLRIVALLVQTGLVLLGARVAAGDGVVVGLLIAWVGMSLLSITVLRSELGRTPVGQGAS